MYLMYSVAVFVVRMHGHGKSGIVLGSKRFYSLVAGHTRMWPFRRPPKAARR